MSVEKTCHICGHDFQFQAYKNCPVCGAITYGAVDQFFDQLRENADKKQDLIILEEHAKAPLFVDQKIELLNDEGEVEIHVQKVKIRGADLSDVANYRAEIESMKKDLSEAEKALKMTSEWALCEGMKAQIKKKLEDLDEIITEVKDLKVKEFENYTDSLACEFQNKNPEKVIPWELFEKEARKHVTGGTIKKRKFWEIDEEIAKAWLIERKMIGGLSVNKASVKKLHIVQPVDGVSVEEKFTFDIASDLSDFAS
jgi:hypothetical protein